MAHFAQTPFKISRLSERYRFNAQHQAPVPIYYKTLPIAAQLLQTCVRIHDNSQGASPSPHLHQRLPVPSTISSMPSMSHQTSALPIASAILNSSLRPYLRALPGRRCCRTSSQSLPVSSTFPDSHICPFGTLSLASRQCLSYCNADLSTSSDPELVLV